MSLLHPAFFLFLTALAAGLVRGRPRQITVVIGSLLALFSLLRLGAEASLTFSLPQHTLELLRVDALSHLFGLILAIITVIGVLYSLHLTRGGEHAATLTYAGSALGVVFAGDWLTLFVFWELMAVSSLFVVWTGGWKDSPAAGFRYLLVHLFGGSLLLAGIVILAGEGGDLTVSALTGAAVSPMAFWLILMGVGLNAAIPPLHAWLSDAYPEGSVTGSVFLSALTTKTAVYVLIRVFPGAEVLAVAGTVMALYGVVYAVLENDTRRLLAYHIVSQVGYMVAGVGMGTALALNGAAAHAFCHILYKALLFMGAGAVIQATGKRKLTELGGVGRQMKLVVGLYMVGAFSISGFPLFNGFISKSMVVSAAAEGGWPILELGLTLASIGTFLHTGLKLPYFTFFGPDRGLRPSPIPLNMILAMAAAALLCTGLGVFPGLLYARLPFAAEYHPYTVDHVVSACQLLIGTGVGFWWLLGKLGGEPTVSLDTDWFYRRPLVSGVRALVEAARAGGRALTALRAGVYRSLHPLLANPCLPVIRLGLAEATIPLGSDPERPPYDEDDFRPPIGLTVFWITFFFAAVAVYTWLKKSGG